jgi:methionyl-tRNA formyltransferase
MKVFGLIDNITGVDLLLHLARTKDLSGILFFDTGRAIDSVSKTLLQIRFPDTPVFQLASNDLSESTDIDLVNELGIDLMITAGWRRLIPVKILDLLKFGAIGSHGSPFGITQGRGRSPQNWAIILGENEFHLSLFWIDPFIDSGTVISTRTFILKESDDIRVSYLKATIITTEQIQEFLDSMRLDFRHELSKSVAQESEARYFPKREPGDGIIDWTQSSAQIQRLVLALAPPYPLARTHIESGYELSVKRGEPFDLNSWGKSKKYGEVLMVTHDNLILVRTGSGAYLIREYYICEKFYEKFKMADLVGTAFTHRSFYSTMNQIVSRHEMKYPNLPLNEVFDEYR